MTNLSIVQPTLLSKINERQVLRALQTCGPLSRAEVARHSGISAPTASKAVESLLRAGLLEEGDAPELLRGRPGKKLRLATESAQALGMVIDAEQCRLVSAGLDGRLHDARLERFPTPSTYEALIETAAECAERLMRRPGVATLGMAISLPGMLDYRQGRGLLSPNVPLTNGRAPGQDLTARLGVECIVVQEAHALCLAERHFGAAQELDNFAVMDVSTGVGLGVMCGGRLLQGHCGLAGEIGHITVEIDGRTCGCGNRGCLETLASDSALAWRVSQRLGRKMTIEEVVALAQTGGSGDSAAFREGLADDLEQTCRYLAVGVAAAINLFNPSTLFLHGKLFAVDPTLFARLIEYTRARTLAPAFAECCIVQAQGSKRQGAIAAIIEHLTNAVVPDTGL